MSAPWMKFYPRDWRGDQALRAVSVAARGLWIDCLCIMHEAKPYGHLVLNGAPVSDDTLARMTGLQVDEAKALMAQLRQAGVLSVTGKGVVYSRRMTKDHARAQKGKKAAGRRWSQPSVLSEENDRPNGLPNGDPITQKPETREQIPKPLAQQPEAARSEPLLLDKLLEANGLADSRLERHPGLFNVSPVLGWTAQGYDLELEILPAIRAKPNRGARSWTYFTGQVADFAANRRGQRAPKAPPDATPDAWATILEHWRSAGEWNPSLGPPPGAPGCRVPADMLARAA